MTNSHLIGKLKRVDLLGGVLKKILKGNSALKIGVEEAQLVALWPEAVGPMIAKHARAVYMKNQTLFIEVDSPIWKQELFTNKQVALKKHNQIAEQHLGPHPQGSWITDLFFMSPGSNPIASKERSRRR